MTGPIALVGSLLEDSGPRGKEGTVPVVLAYPHSVFLGAQAEASTCGPPTYSQKLA